MSLTRDKSINEFLLYIYMIFTPFLKYQMKPNTQVMYIYKHKHKHEEYISFYNKQHENQTRVRELLKMCYELHDWSGLTELPMEL